jgi:dTMP kinase|uniref:Probable thymidylate kinase n=1 Tax=Ignisphaera aggregans TaxID=334771 RepID=A0A7J2U599_9CREN
MLIVLEGIDATGKTTISKMLKELMESRGFSVALYAYPNKTSIYGSIIKLFLDSKLSLTPEEQFFLYILDMFRDREDVLNKLSKGFIVIMDRYFTSTIAYQCAQSFNYDFAKKIIEYLKLPKPDVIIYLDLDPKIAIERKLRQKENLDIFEREEIFLAKVRKLYFTMIEEGYPTRNWIKVTASKNIGEVYNEVIESLNHYL